MAIVFGKGVTVNIFASGSGLTANAVFEVEEHMQSGGAVPKEKRLLVLRLAVEEIERFRHDLIVERLHSLRGQRAFVLRRTIGSAGNNSTRVELLAELRISRAIGIFKVFIAVEMVEVAEVLVEAMPVRQVLFQIAKMILAKLSSGVALCLQDLGERDVFLLQSGRRARRADRCQAGANRKLARQERRSSCGAARLRVEGSQANAFLADTVDIRSFHSHDVTAVG